MSYWKCLENLYMDDGDLSFKANKVYRVVNHDIKNKNATVIDEQNMDHFITSYTHGDWYHKFSKLSETLKKL